MSKNDEERNWILFLLQIQSVWCIKKDYEALRMHSSNPLLAAVRNKRNSVRTRCGPWDGDWNAVD